MIDYQLLRESLCSQNVPLAKRFRALFSLKALTTEQSIDIISEAFEDPSALLRHELAYVLGQMKHPYAIPQLNKVLATMNEDPMVRHEAAEALGAIGQPESLKVLKTYLDDPVIAVRETVVLAISRIEYEMEAHGHKASSYTSIDPAPPIDDEKSIEEMHCILMDSSKSLFERYRAMFSLRNSGTEDAVLALADGFADESALFRHEIAYVFGQMQHPASVPSLIQVLRKETEEPMVRHEAAEALGSIATPECLPILKQYSQDSQRVVRESCIVGLDMLDYENSSEFQYCQMPNSR